MRRRTRGKPTATREVSCLSALLPACSSSSYCFQLYCSSSGVPVGTDASWWLRDDFRSPRARLDRLKVAHTRCARRGSFTRRGPSSLCPMRSPLCGVDDEALEVLLEAPWSPVSPTSSRQWASYESGNLSLADVDGSAPPVDHHIHTRRVLLTAPQRRRGSRRVRRFHPIRVGRKLAPPSLTRFSAYI